MNGKVFVLVGVTMLFVLSLPLWGAATRMYWLEWERETLERANVDGSNHYILITGGLETPRNVCLDVQAGKIYFCTNVRIERANLDGSERELLISLSDSVQHMALDLVGRKMYWIAVGPASIKRADLDGANIETVISGYPDLASCNSLAVDGTDKKMYWTDLAYHTIKRANLDGSEIETLIDGLNTPWDIELDVDGERMYWVNTAAPGGEILSAKFDGSDVRVVLYTCNPRHIALDVEAGKIFVANYSTIFVSNLDGFGDIILLYDLMPRGIALDVVAVPPIACEMRFTPQALNYESEGKWVKAHIVLPEGYYVEDVDANSPVKIVKPFKLECEYKNIFANEEGLIEVEAAFSRGDFCGYGPIDANIVVEGMLISGERFRGEDRIKIVNNNFEFLAGLVPYWLEAACGRPDWCDGHDLDRNGAVDFVDIALFDACCVKADSGARGG